MTLKKIKKTLKKDIKTLPDCTSLETIKRISLKVGDSSFDFLIIDDEEVGINKLALIIPLDYEKYRINSFDLVFADNFELTQAYKNNKHLFIFKMKEGEIIDKCVEFAQKLSYLNNTVTISYYCIEDGIYTIKSIKL